MGRSYLTWETPPPHGPVIFNVGGASPRARRGFLFKVGDPPHWHHAVARLPLEVQPHAFQRFLSPSNCHPSCCRTSSGADNWTGQSVLLLSTECPVEHSGGYWRGNCA